MTAVAIYTDASIYRGDGAWATVILRDGHDMVETAGKLRGRFQSSTAVEGAAIANALWFARKRHLIERGDVVTIRSDNQPIVHRIRAIAAERPWRDAKDPVIMRAVAYVFEAIDGAGINLRAAWVRGHQRLDSADPHALFNRRCDQLCGAARKGIKPPSWRMLQEQHAAHQRRREKRERSPVTEFVPPASPKKAAAHAAFMADVAEARARREALG